MVGGGGSRRGRWLVVGALAAGVLSALTVVLALAAPDVETDHSIPRGATNLSQQPDRRSYFADISVSPDGDRVVVVWTEAYTDGGAARGSVWLRWASESTGSGWRAPVTVFAGSSQEYAIGAAVAVTGTTIYTAHIAYIVQYSDTQEIRHRTYRLGGTLGGSSLITSATPGGDAGFGRVDIALDAQSNPHFGYIYYGAEEVGTVYYRGISEGGLGTEEQVSELARNPAIAWSDGYVHIVWEDAEEYQILYSCRDGAWRDSKNLTNDRGNENARPRNPDIAAYGGRVVVTWDWEQIKELEPNQYAVTYAYSNTSMSDWLLAREVGTDVGLWDPWTPDPPQHPYTSTDDVEAVLSAYLLGLRPAVALDGEGRPTVVWHANRGTGGDVDYDIMYIQAQSVTVTGTTWLTPTALNPGSQKSGSSVVAVAPITSPHLHVAYLNNVDPILGQGDWETYYSVVAGNGGADLPHDVFLPVVLRSFSSETLSKSALRRRLAITVSTDRPVEFYQRSEE